MRALFPHAARLRQSHPRLVGMSLETAQGLSGAETVVPTLRGRWEIDCTFVVRGEAAILGWQAFVAQMEGRVGTTLVPVISQWRPRDRDGHRVPPPRARGFADAQIFEHFGFDVDPAVTMEVLAPAALRATEILVAPQNTSGLRPGQLFTIGERLYRTRYTWETDAGTRVSFQPPLRAAVAMGALVVLDRTQCLMRFRDEDAAEIPYLNYAVREVTVTFREAI